MVQWRDPYKRTAPPRQTLRLKSRIEPRPTGAKRWFKPTSDSGLAAMGFVAALGSATFATFMINNDNSHPIFGGAEHLMLFSRPLRSLPEPTVQVAQARPEQGIDYDPTGTIARSGAPQTAETPGGAGTLRGVPPLKGYVVRAVHEGIARVAGPKGIYDVAVGTVLPDVGRIVSVEFRAGQWVVVTEGGIIGEPVQPPAR